MQTHLDVVECVGNEELYWSEHQWNTEICWDNYLSKESCFVFFFIFFAEKWQEQLLKVYTGKKHFPIPLFIPVENSLLP